MLIGSSLGSLTHSPHIFLPVACKTIVFKHQLPDIQNCCFPTLVRGDASMRDPGASSWVEREPGGWRETPSLNLHTVPVAKGTLALSREAKNGRLSHGLAPGVAKLQCRVQSWREGNCCTRFVQRNHFERMKEMMKNKILGNVWWDGS